MAPDTEDVDIRIALKRAAAFQRDARKSARAIEEIGDEAKQAARGLALMNAASSKSRISLGPFSTSMRGGAIAAGGLALATGKLTPSLLGLAEATATVVGGAGAAGGVGLLALAQGAGVAELGLAGLGDALGGNEDAIRKLSPQARELFTTLSEAKSTLGDTAQAGMMPGLTRGAGRAMRNFDVLNGIVKDTAETLGGLGEDAGAMFGSKEWGRDLQKVGRSNVRILDDLGHAGLDLADAAKDVVVEAGPLTEWLAASARDGARFVKVWAEGARASGDMAVFFREARTELSLLASISGHGGSGIVNLFGSADIDGAKTLANLDRMMARFERWTDSPAVRAGLGDAIVAEIPDAIGAVAEGLAHAMPVAGAKAAELFFEGFMEADAWGKLLMGGFLFKKLGGFKAAGNRLGRGGGPLGIAGKAAPVPVFVTNPGFGTPDGIVPVPDADRKKTDPKKKGSRGGGLPSVIGGLLGLEFGDDIVRAGMGRGNFDQYSGSKGWGELVRDLNTGPMTRPSQPNLNPGADPMRRVADITLQIDGVTLNRLSDRVRNRRQASN
jgi:hypothetical protein